MNQKDARTLEEDLLMGPSDEMDECGEEYTGPLFAPLREKGCDNNLQRYNAMFLKHRPEGDSYFGRIISENKEDSCETPGPKKVRVGTAEPLVPTPETIRLAEMGDLEAVTTIRTMKRIMKNRATAKDSHKRRARKYTEMGDMINKLQNENDMYLAQLVVAQSTADKVDHLVTENAVLRERLSAFLAADS
jgi:hypothetical protein